MTDADMPSEAPQGPGAPSSRPTDNNHHPQTIADTRDVAMIRNRSRDRGGGTRDRVAVEREPRVSAIDPQPRLHSQSPTRRDQHNHLEREKHPHREKAHATNEESIPDRSHRGRSRDRPRNDHDSARGARRRSPGDEQLQPSRHREGVSPPRQRPKPDEKSELPPRDRSHSPTSRKRRRSQSPLPLPAPKSKKSRRERERDRRRKAERDDRLEREYTKGPGPARYDRTLSPLRRGSPSRDYDDLRYRYSDRREPLDRPRHRHRSRSPLREADFKRGAASRPRVDPLFRGRSRSPRPTSRRSSFSRTHSPPRHLGRPPAGPLDAGSHSRRSSPSFDQSRAEYPPHSPRDRASRRSRKKAKSREEPRFPSDGQPTGANSIEVNMSRLSDSRGDGGRDGRSELSTQLPPRHPAKTHHSDSRYAQSPSHANSGSSFHGSPTAQSPYGNGRAARYSQHQYSPQSQRPSQQSQGNRGPPTGPSAHRVRSQSPQPPSGPAAQADSRGHGFSRGRFRGGSYSTRRYRDGSAPRSAQRDAPAEYSRGHSSPPHDGTLRNLSPQNTTSNHPDLPGESDEAEIGTLGPSEDAHVESPAPEKVPTEVMPPPGPPGPPPTAPTGPSGSKFSFAFKATNKAPVAAPKPEISQKFSAAPKKGAQRDDDDNRDLPRDTPREPASARARNDQHDNKSMPEQPRTRKVMRKIRTLKPKPSLEPEYAKSKSVYFRKPGNESVIGAGTYGKVFKAVHVYMKRTVALKKIRMEGERDGFPVTATREVKLLQSLKHTNIVNLQEVMIEKNDCYMVFEYLSHDLTGLLNHPGYRLDASERKHLAKQLFEGLDYLHNKGVLHRDIKAANILVSNEGVLKLADFGLARFYAKGHKIDYTNRVVTIWYRSPELLLGETQYAAAVDIWSAACVMVEIFTRHAIFPGDGGEISQLEKIYSVLGTPNPKEWPGLVDMPWFELLRPGYRKRSTFVEKYRERVPAAAFELLTSMFQYDPVKRPSASDALEHPYFTTEQPPPRQAIQLKHVQGDWHEFESKALRREKERKEKQERDARRAAAAKDGNQRDKEKKRPSSSHDAQREAKRPHVEGQPPNMKV